MTTTTVTLKRRTSVGQMDRINFFQDEIRSWWNNRHSKEGRTRLTEARRAFAETSVSHGGGKSPYHLATQDDVAKTRDHNGDIWEQVILYAAAARTGAINACLWSTTECRAGCLQTSGHLGMSHGQIAMLVRSHFWWGSPFDAAITLLAETERHAERIHSKGKLMAQRLNGTTDHPWEDAEWFMGLLREAGVDIHFDYTKGRHRQSTDLYYLAHSVTENDSYADIEPGMVVIVDAEKGSKLPKTWNRMPVIDGDLENGDLRFLDRGRPDAVVLLRKKGRLRRSYGNEFGFVKPLHV